MIDQDEKYRVAIQRAGQAETELEIVREAVIEFRGMMIEIIENSRPDDVTSRENAASALRAMNFVIGHLKSRINSGKYAREQMRSQVQGRPGVQSPFREP